MHLKKAQFNATYSTRNTGRKFITIILSLMIIAYFIQAYFNHIRFADNLKYIQSTLPVFMDRFRFMMLIYGLNRERLVMNNSLDTFESYEGYGYNADSYYKE